MENVRHRSWGSVGPPSGVEFAATRPRTFVNVRVRFPLLFTADAFTTRFR